VNEAALYIIAQIAGGTIGKMVAHMMFGHPLIDFSMKVRAGGARGSRKPWPRSGWSSRFWLASASSA
jgi:glycerol uptake facilitator-like aquaporin